MAELYVDSQLKKNVNYAESIQWTDSTKLNLTKHNWTEESKRKKKKEFRKKKKNENIINNRPNRNGKKNRK